VSIGTSRRRVDAIGKVTGDALYPADLTPGDPLAVKVVFSDQPHARMTGMDVTSALGVAGVVAVFTAADVPVNEYGLTVFDQPVLVGVDATGRSEVPSDVSRWEADQIAVVVAETVRAAALGAAAIHVEWEPLPLVADIDRALTDEILVHPEKGTNAYVHYKARKGDMEAGWAAADVIIDGTYHVPHQEHAYLQPEAAVSYIDDQGRVTVEIAGQWTHEDRAQIAHALDLAEDRVRVVYPAIGGAFGGREDMSLQIVMALAAMRLHERGIRRPLRCVWSREESIVGHHKRHRGVIHARWGATTQGDIVAVEADAYLDAGAYNYTTNKVAGNLHLTVAGPYEIPNARIDTYGVYTNTVPGGAFRGFGAPQGAFVAEAQMTKLAAALGMDAVALRLRNGYQEGSIGIAGTAMPEGVSLTQVIEACVQAAGWPEGGNDAITAPFSAFQSLPAKRGAVRSGRGFACAYKNIGFSFGFPESCTAEIEVHGDEEPSGAVLYHSAAEVGQGTHTALTQMAAEALGLPVEDVAAVWSDTARTTDSGSVSASRMTWMAGNAILGAAEEAMKAWNDGARPATGQFRFVPPPTEPLDQHGGPSEPNFAYGYVAETADVSVDIETGHVVVSWVVCATDVGRAVNPTLIEGQIEGGVVQAHGYAVTEHLQLGEGRILNPTLSTYLIPGIGDIPERVTSVIVEVPDPRGPWGVRGMAEMPFIPYAAAVAAAMHDATGVWFDEFPLTPGRVVATLRANGVTP